MVPDTRKTSNITATVTFEIKSGTEKFQEKRTILIMPNPTYSLATTSLFGKLEDNKVLLPAQLNQLALMMKHEIDGARNSSCKNPSERFLSNIGACNASDSSSCCGNGQCMENFNTKKYYCSCNATHSGIFCDVDRTQFDATLQLTKLIIDRLNKTIITKNNVATIISTLQKVVASNTLDLNSLKSAKSILEKAIKSVSDFDTLQNLMKTASKIFQTIRSGIKKVQ